MTETEYEAVVSSAAADLTNVINPLDWTNFRGGRPMEDETFRRDFEANPPNDRGRFFDFEVNQEGLVVTSC